jgi:hypothetical protein
MRTVNNLVEIYEDYVKAGGTLAKSLFKNILQDFNYHMVGEMLDGAVMDMGIIGHMKVMRFEDNEPTKFIDWQASRKIKDRLIAEGKQLYDKKTGQGERWLVYRLNEHTKGFLIRFAWLRPEYLQTRKDLSFMFNNSDRGAVKRLAFRIREEQDYWRGVPQI